ncbi:MAG: hypothetical protein QM473_14755 [Acidobacteriota bacterium]|nr:hypothetical protein [Acidobacteriota bacterium]
MPTLRLSLTIAAVLSLSLFLILPCLAQTGASESIYIANTKVITIREKGTYNSIRDRAVAIDKAITQVISTQDTQKLNLTMKEEGGLWRIYAGPVQIVTVFPSEAKANGLPPKSLAAAWVKNLREAFPRCTPCSKLPASAFQPKPGQAPAVVTPKPPAPGNPKPEAPEAPAAPVATVAEVTPPAVAPANPVVAAIGAPELLVRDAFNTVRALSEEEYTHKREELVQHLIQDLTPFITGKVASTLRPGTTHIAAVPAETGPAVPITPTPVEPVEPATEPVAPVEPSTSDTEVTTAPPVGPTPVASTVSVPTPSPEASVPAATNLPAAKSGDPSYAKVPQKNRIRKKLEATREPYLNLRKDNPDAAKPIADLLAACRSAYARADFDESERYVDSALKLLGVDFTE